MANFYQTLQSFLQLVEQQQPLPQLPPQLRNLDQLKVLLDTLPDYHSGDEQPSYVLAIPCRPIVVGLCSVLPGAICMSSLSWGRLLADAAEAPPS